MIYRLFRLLRMPFGLFGVLLGLALVGVLLVPTIIQWVLTGNDSIITPAIDIVDKASDWLFLAC